MYIYIYIYISRLTVVSRTAKESRIYACAIIKNATTMRIYTHNNGACIHPYQTTVLLTNIA